MVDDQAALDRERRRQVHEGRGEEGLRREMQDRHPASERMVEGDGGDRVDGEVHPHDEEDAGGAGAGLQEEDEGRRDEVEPAVHREEPGSRPVVERGEAASSGR